MEPMHPPTDREAASYDPSHFVTRVGVVTAEQIAEFAEVEQVGDLSERYVGGADFTPEQVGVDLWHIEDNARVHDLVSALQAADLDGRPVYYFGFEGHWSLEPGSEAAHRHSLPERWVEGRTAPSAHVDSTGANLKQGSDGGAHVAVVDGGFFPTLPLSMSGTDSGEMGDDDANGVHGTMVLGLIELGAPNAPIDYFAARQLRDPFVHTLLAGHWHRQAASDIAFTVRCSDDMAVAAAMSNVAEALASVEGPDYRYLNLSLGTYLPALSSGSGPNLGLAPLSIELALDTAAQYGVTVIAAAGNDILGTTAGGAIRQFYPACRPDVTAIGAADCLGDPIMWHHGNRFRHRESWWNHTAPGIDLISAPYEYGNGHVDGIRWSGSSFAAAVATGYFAAGNPVGNVAYDDVKGLTYLSFKTMRTQ